MSAPQCKGNSMAWPCLSLKSSIWQELLACYQDYLSLLLQTIFMQVYLNDWQKRTLQSITGCCIRFHSLNTNATTKPALPSNGICTQLQLTLKLHVLGGKKSSLLTHSLTHTQQI